VAVVDAGGNQQVFNTPSSVSLAPGQHTVDVYAEDQGGNAVHQQLALEADAYQWLSPLSSDGSSEGKAGRTIPVQFQVMTADGQFVSDSSVLVDILDGQGNVAVPAVQFSHSPAQGVVIQGAKYHANLSTTGLAPGQYLIRVQFNSGKLTGSFMVPITLK
jgi:hypothetical protein